MGLGKTLQGISLMWTLLQQGSPALGGKPIAKVTSCNFSSNQQTCVADMLWN
jgi:hypothetical protein